LQIGVYNHRFAKDFNAMDETLKKFLYAGVGLVTITAEKLQETVDRMVDDGKLSREDGKSMLQEFLTQTEAKKDDWEERLRDFAENAFERINFVPRSEYEKLEIRVARLEAKIEGISKQPETSSKPVVKRTVKKIEP
jgi:polyhydroxyalkanoate synthesis regulator phasin